MQPDFRQYKMTAAKFRLKFSSGLFPNMETKGYICIGLKRMLMKSKENFKIIYSEETVVFLNSLDIKARAKIMYNINKCKYVIDKELFKKLNEREIWEFRTSYGGISYRILAFWDTETEALVLTTHGFVKKKQKTPAKEIEKAEEIRRQYFNLKK